MVRGLALSLAAAATALLAASAAPGASGAPAVAASSAKLSPSVRLALRSVPAARRGKAVLRSAATAELAAGEFAGVAYCGNDAAYAWPADAPGHDVTITRTYVLHSASGTFADAVVDPSPYYLVQVGPDYYFWDIAGAETLYGPATYADAWYDPDLGANTDYVLFVNEVTAVDGGTFSTEYVLVEAVGPSEIGTSNVCRP